MKWSILQLVVVMVTAFGLMGCEPAPPSVEALRQRVEGYWEARIANDLFAQFEFEIAKPLALVRLQDYVQRGAALRFDKAEIVEIKAESPTQALVVMQVEYILPALGNRPIRQNLSSSWTVYEGQWYHDSRRNNEVASARP